MQELKASLERDLSGGPVTRILGEDGDPMELSYPDDLDREWVHPKNQINSEVLILHHTDPCSAAHVINYLSL